MAAVGNVRRARRTGRQEEISRIGRAARGGLGPARNAGGLNPRAQKGLGPMPLGPAQARLGGEGRSQRPGIAPARQAGLPLGAQLQRRLKSGAITATQAQRTARERQTLKAKFGADWRTKLPGGLGAFRQARQKLAANPNDPKLMALNKRLMGRRSQLLASARGAGQPRPGGRVNPRGTGLMNPAGESPVRPRRRRVAPARRAY